MANPMAAFQGVNASTDAQKAALGQFIAAQGSAGVESWKAEQAVGQQMASDARAGVSAANPGIGQPNMGSAVGPGQLTQMLAARAAQPGQLMASQGAQAAADYGAYTGLLGQANSNYGDAVKGAAPIVASQTASKVAAIQAELAAKRLAMQQEADDAAQARADRQRERDWATQDRMLMLGDQQRERQWAIDDRNAELRETKEATRTAGGAQDAAKVLGYDEKTRDRITSSDHYAQAKAEVDKLITPGMDQAQIEGLIKNAVHTVSGTKTGNYGTIAMLSEQYRHLAGEKRLYDPQAAQLAEHPKPKGGDEGGGGGGGGFSFNPVKVALAGMGPIAWAGLAANEVLGGDGGGKGKAGSPATTTSTGTTIPADADITKLSTQKIRLLSTKDLMRAVRELPEGSAKELVAWDELRSRPDYNGG